MDFQAIVDSMAAMTCVVSVEKLDGDRYGKVRIVTGNRSYIDSIEKPVPGVAMLSDKFIPNSEYTTYFTRDLNFEEYCYQAAVHKKCLHSYVHPDRYDVWFDLIFLPMEPHDGNIYYCTYTMEIDLKADSERLSNISGDVASAVLETCIKLRSTDNFKGTMNEVMEDIRVLCNAGHGCIILVDDYDRSCSVLCEAFREDANRTPMTEYMQDDFYSITETWHDTIAGSNCIIAKNDQDLEVIKERNPVWYESLMQAHPKNIVLFPLKSNEHLLGYMWVVNFDADEVVNIKETLELTAFLLGLEIGSHMLLDRLKFLSSKDMLTGVANRNEMNNYVSILCAGECMDGTNVGVIFADLNGLKTINDTEGHTAGDNLLRDAAKVLKESFSDSEIFRAGGDEFAIIVTGVTEDELKKKMEAIRRDSQRYQRVSFALGYAVEENASDIRTALKLADERMYADKKIYYETHPKDLRNP